MAKNPDFYYECSPEDKQVYWNWYCDFFLQEKWRNTTKESEAMGKEFKETPPDKVITNEERKAFLAAVRTIKFDT